MGKKGQKVKGLVFCAGLPSESEYGILIWNFCPESDGGLRIAPRGQESIGTREIWVFFGHF